MTEGSFTSGVRRLAESFLNEAARQGTILLYYTGLTRVAKGILQEVVRGVLLNNSSSASILRDIASNAHSCAGALQREDWDSLSLSVSRSWELNQGLDAGTNPPPVQKILGRVSDFATAAKLLGAGGGGYLLLMAKDEEAGRRIRRTLEQNPPNPGARFSDFAISTTGMEIGDLKEPRAAAGAAP